MNAFERWLAARALTHFLKGEQMQKIIEWFSGKKTYLTGVGTLLVALASLLGVAVPGIPVLGHDTAIQAIVTALLGIFIRQGVTKSGPA